MTVGALNAAFLSQQMYKSQLEFSIASISNKQQQIAYQTLQLSDVDWENDPRIKQLQAMDEYLELNRKNLETQLKTATTQLESFQKAVETNSKKDFTITLA